MKNGEASKHQNWYMSYKNEWIRYLGERLAYSICWCVKKIWKSKQRQSGIIQATN